MNHDVLRDATGRPKSPTPRIGVTQKCDAAIDQSWNTKAPSMDGVILFTRNPDQNGFSFKSRNLQTPHIVHIRLSGWEGTDLEPGGMSLKDKLAWVQKYIRDGFDQKHLVLNFDPVIPNGNGIAKLASAIKACMDAGLLPGTRARLSVLKEYGCIKEQLKAIGKKPFYPDFRVFPNSQELNGLTKNLKNRGIRFEICACDGLLQKSSHLFIKRSCVSRLDLELMGLDTSSLNGYYPTRRPDGCRCLPKTELSQQSCGNKCVCCPYKNNHD